MSYRYYFKMFKNEPDVLTVPDVVRLLQFGKNTVYGRYENEIVLSYTTSNSTSGRSLTC